jgi:hypothetical protein
MKTLVMRASFFAAAVMAMVVGTPGTAQDSGAAPGYCTVDCSRCATSQECRSRGAGTCTPISACRAPSQE